MQRSFISDLDFDTVLKLVAAHAATCVGRDLLQATRGLPGPAEARRAANLTREMARLVGEDGRLPLAGINEALPWLDDEGPSPREISALLILLGLARRIAGIRRRLVSAPGELELLHQLKERLPETQPLVDWAGTRLGRDGRIPDQATPELARIRRQLVEMRRKVLKELEGVRRSHGDAVTDAPPTVRRDRYCIPVKASARSQLSGLVLDGSGSGATVFMEPYSAVELNNALVEAALREAEEVRRIVDEVAAAFAAVRGDLIGAVEVLAELDAAQARALFGNRVDGHVVEPGAGDELVLCGMRHPLLDERLHELRVVELGYERPPDRQRSAVPLDLRLPEEIGTLIVSGPNAGGKTILLKTVGLAVLMAYHGVPIPADEGTMIPPIDHLWCHIGDEQNVAADLSTFSGTMASTARLLSEAGPRSLVIFDELGTGTDPLEGGAIGLALLEELTRRRCLVLASTHLASMALEAGGQHGMINAAMEYDEAASRPTYTVRFGRPGRSRALEIAQAMGVPEPVLERARELLGGGHLQLDRWLERLEAVEAEVLIERAAMHRARLEAEQMQRHLDEDRARLKDDLEAVPRRLAEERDRLRRRAKQQLDQALAAFSEATREHKALGRRRQQQLRDAALDLPVETRADANGAAALDRSELEPGVRVRLRALGSKGELQELRGTQALVVVQGKRLWVARDELDVVGRPRPASPVASVRIEAEESVAAELMLLGHDTEQARSELERYLDQAFTSGRPMVRVVHGHGTGALRRVVREICQTHPVVRSFAHPPSSRGGTGATEVWLEQPGG